MSAFKIEFINTCDVTANLCPIDIAAKSNRKIIKIKQESRQKETESGDLVCANRAAMSIADEKQNAITTFCH